jgi:hypothetical protein
MSRHRQSSMFPIRLALLILFMVSPSLTYAADMKPQDLVAKHLDSIATAEVRGGLKSLIVQGTSEFKIRVGSSGELRGTSALVSQGRKAVVMMKLTGGDYRGEQFVTDGDKVSVAATTPNHRHTSFGEFVRSQDQIVSEGLLGGTFTTAWALLNLGENKPRLSFDGEKKIDGHSVYQLTYHSRKKDDLTVHLYFDPETYRHVMTTYSITLASGLGGSSPSLSDQVGLTSPSTLPSSDPTQSSKQRETRYTLEERFSDFKTAEGLTLPTKYVIHFTEELQNGSTNVFEWDVTADEVSNNQPLDPKNFLVK